MSTVDSKPMSSVREGGRRNAKPFVVASVVVAVFVLAVITMALRDGAGGAALTVLGAVVIAATALGLWGTAMAVRETDRIGSRSEE
jgi:hypothetical protein